MQKKLPNKPFFARFLEKQELDKVSSGQTLKYPSDRDEGPEFPDATATTPGKPGEG
jgi:hypothetical protein